MENPVKNIRRSAKLTQVDFSDQANVSRDVLIRTEAGTYSLIPPKILRVAASISAFSEEEISKAYFKWQSRERYKNGAGIILKGETYQEFRWNQYPSSVAGFCKMLCIDLSKWTRLETKGGSAEFLMEVLNDVSPAAVEFGRKLEKSKP